MPEDGVSFIPHSQIMSYENIYDFTRIATNYGITKVKITGGEPLVRKNIDHLIKLLSSIPQITDLSLTTNGTLLEKYAKQLKDAGLKRINISLDTMDPKKYSYITRGGNIKDVINGIKAAMNAKFDPIKINCVVAKDIHEKDAIDVTKFCEDNNLKIQYITKMNLEKGYFSDVNGGHGGICHKCNRLRLTSNGLLFPCLFNNISFNIKELGYENAILNAIRHKPSKGSFNTNVSFYQIGG